MFLRRLKRRQTKRVELAYALIALIRNQQNVRQQINFALPEQFQVVNRAFRLMDADDLACLTVDYDLVFYGMTFLFA